MITDELKTEIRTKIQLYQEANFWACYPSGNLKEWIIEGVAHNIVTPMQTEIDALKKEIEQLKNN